MKISVYQLIEVLKRVPEKPEFFNPDFKDVHFIRIPVGQFVETGLQSDSFNMPQQIVYNTIDLIWNPIMKDWMLELPNKYDNKSTKT